MAGLFQVMWGKDDGTFAAAEVLNGTDDEPLIIPVENEQQDVEAICTRPTAVDWNGDDKLDLLVGNFAGSFYLFEGNGEGKFNPKPTQIMVEGKPLVVDGAHSDPFVVDWDSDGDLDVLSGSSSGGVYWSENTAGKGEQPKLKQFVQIIAPGMGRLQPGQTLKDEELEGPSSSTRVWADDVNGDGKLDLLVGDSVTLISPAKGVTEDEFKTKYKDWSTEFQQALQDAQSSDDEVADAGMEKYNKLYQARSEFMREEMTGFVWLYVQK